MRFLRDPADIKTVEIVREDLCDWIATGRRGRWVWAGHHFRQSYYANVETFLSVQPENFLNRAALPGLIAANAAYMT